jgi:hypothetical protein
MPPDENPPDTWLQFLPDLHRTLAAPFLATGLPRSFVGLDFEQSCAWWETLRYIFRSLLGWQCLPAGLAWWYDAGKPDLGDPRLALVLSRWNTWGELDFFAAREWETRGMTGCGQEERLWSVHGHEPAQGWLSAIRTRANRPEYCPWGGGWNPLHLGHSDIMETGGPGDGADLATWDESCRAVLVVSRFDVWRRELKEHGAKLPPSGDRSWHVEVFDRRVGFLGRFRRSRVTGLWFQGRHNIHMRGNQ